MVFCSLSEEREQKSEKEKYGNDYGLERI